MMPGQGRAIDPVSDMAARIGGLVLSPEEPYHSPHQQSAHSHIPAAHTHSYPNVQTPTARSQNQAQVYPTYPDQQSFPYYPSGNGGVTVDGYSGGMPVPTSATYAYPTTTTSELISLAPPQPTAAYDGFPADGEVYSNISNNRQGGHHPQQQGQLVNSPMAQQDSRGGRQNQRPQRSQGGFQQQQQQAAINLQQHANAAAAAGFFGYQDPRPYWMNAQPGLYVPQANERKKGYQGGPFQLQGNQASQGDRAGQGHLGNSRSTYSDTHTPTHGHFSMGRPMTAPYGGSQHSSIGHFQLTQTPGYSSLNPYAGSPSYTGASSFLFRSRRLEDSGEVRSALLEDFRLNKTRKWDLRDIFGHVVEFSGDQQGSRLIQQKLEAANPEDRQKLFDEIMPNAYQLMTDVFGNYVTQKMFEHGDQIQKAALAKKMEGHVLQLSMQTYGCRVVQKALEHVLVDQRTSLVSELKGHILDCVKNSNANHVIQRLITLDPPKDVPDAFIGHVGELSKHPYGCRVLQKMFENLDEDMKRPLLDEMHQYTMALMEDQFGNYVVQSVITVGAPEDRDKVVAEMKGKVLRLARHKFASNVIEKAIINASEADQKLLVDELIDLKPDGSNQVGMLLRDAFGNFPLQTALIASNPEQRQVLLDIISPIFPQIRHTPVGKRLEMRLNQFEHDGIFPSARKSISSSTNTTATATTTTATVSEATDLIDMSRSNSSETVPVSPEPRNSKIKRADSTTPKTPNSSARISGNENGNAYKAAPFRTGENGRGDVNDGEALEKLLQ